MYQEEFIEYLWTNRLYTDILLTLDGKKIKILKTGKKNIYEGPDFLNAEIIVKKQKIITDVEIDVLQKNWISHNHHSNPLYSKVKLHIIFCESKQNIKRFQYIPEFTINLSNQLTDSIENTAAAWKQTASKKKFSCNIKKLSEKSKIYSFIEHSGIKQFETKTENISKYLKKYGLLKSFIIFISRALGYGNNKENFTKLAELINIDFLKTKCINLRKISCSKIIFDYLINISGLKKSNDFFSNENNYFSSGCGINWHILKSRPANNYLFRLKNLSNLIAGLLFLNDDEFIEILQEKNLNYKKLKLYFDSILNFDQDNFKSIGTHHLDIILSNSVVPILYSHYNLNGDRFMSAKMKNMMFNLKGCLINSKIILLSKKMGLNLKIINSKFLYQLGIFYIFDNFCLNFSTIKSGTNPEISPL